MFYIHGKGIVRANGYQEASILASIVEKQNKRILKQLALSGDIEISKILSEVLDNILQNAHLMEYQKEAITDIFSKYIVYEPKKDPVQDVIVKDYSILSEYHRNLFTDEEKDIILDYYSDYYRKRNVYPNPETDINIIKKWHTTLTQEQHLSEL